MMITPILPAHLKTESKEKKPKQANGKFKDMFEQEMAKIRKNKLLPPTEK